MQQRIIETFLELLEREYRKDGKSEDIIKDRLTKLRRDLERRPDFSLKSFINKKLKNLGVQLTIDDFLDKIIFVR